MSAAKLITADQSQPFEKPLGTTQVTFAVCSVADTLPFSWQPPCPAVTTSPNSNETARGHVHMLITVRDNNVDQALRALKKKLQREGVYREMKLRRHYEKPSEKRAREHAAAVSRARKADRKRQERDR
jgi:small subunit ribosomal protein S21